MGRKPQTPRGVRGRAPRRKIGILVVGKMGYLGEKIEFELRRLARRADHALFSLEVELQQIPLLLLWTCGSGVMCMFAVRLLKLLELADAHNMRLRLSVRFAARQRVCPPRSGGRDGDASERLKNAKMISPAPPFAPFDETGGKMCASSRSVSSGTKCSV